MILHANCKINLGLDVLRRREDGYHELSTVMFPVRGLYDVVGVTRTAVPGVRFLSEGLAVDCAPGENICVKAFLLMRERYGVDGVEIRLDKRVPFGAGLGGGSSDGTAVLLALDGLFGLRLAEAELVALAAELGSDTAFFVRNTPQLCTGRGEIMEPYPLCLAGMTLVVVKPDVGVSTREAYAGVRPHVPEVPLAERLRRPVAEWQGLVTNDFEPHIFAAILPSAKPVTACLRPGRSMPRCRAAARPCSDFLPGPMPDGCARGSPMFSLYSAACQNNSSKIAIPTTVATSVDTMHTVVIAMQRIYLTDAPAQLMRNRLRRMTML